MKNAFLKIFPNLKYAFNAIYDNLFIKEIL